MSIYTAQRVEQSGVSGSDILLVKSWTPDKCRGKTGGFRKVQHAKVEYETSHQLIYHVLFYHPYFHIGFCIRAAVWHT
jgi:hypothetical protein